jgi:hypothetical protein
MTARRPGASMGATGLSMASLPGDTWRTICGRGPRISQLPGLR